VEFISGRTGKILCDGKEIGVIGEVSPRVLKNWGINKPVVSLELDVEGFI
jgi:phenylalanyl-tRNA synthetase beta chain